jgi:hypothetical protein
MGTVMKSSAPRARVAEKWLQVPFDAAPMIDELVVPLQMMKGLLQFQ